MHRDLRFSNDPLLKKNCKALFVSFNCLMLAFHLAHVSFLSRCAAYSQRKFAKLLVYMSGYNLFNGRGNNSLFVNAKCVSLSILLFFGILGQANSQSQTHLSDDLKLYSQAVKSKDYKKASQYAIAIAKSYHESKETNKAIDQLNQAQVYIKKSGDLSLLYTASHQLGMLNVEIKKYSKAQENFQNALSTAQQLKDGTLIKEEYMNLASSYSLAGKYKKSIEFADEALSLAISQGDTELQQKCYQLLAEYYSKDGNARKSAEYKAQYSLLIKAQQSEELKKREVKELQQHIAKAGIEKRATQSKLTEQTKILQQTNDSLRLIENSLRVTEDSLKEVEAISKNRQMAIDLLQKDKELADVRIKEQETRIEKEALVRNSIIGGSLLSLALITVLVINYRKKIKTNEKIDQQNKNIKSSINYAKRIQEAMLPKIDQHPGIFDNSFILFQPRDTVSGDFYWLSDVKNGAHHADVAFAAVDCTGHGVPGAFMSMIGINALNGLVNRGITETNRILDSLDQEIRAALRQDISGNNDGMDVALCIYRQRERVLEFSGAKNPLVYIQDNKLFQVKGDVHSIGGVKNKHEFLFKKHAITIDKPTLVYLFSDGYKDQFGGKDNGKFLSKRLNKLLLEIHHLPMKEQMNILQRTMDEWKGTHDQTDDILVMGLKLDPSNQ